MPATKNKIVPKITNEKGIEKNDIVTLSYMLVDEKDNVVDCSTEEQPLVLQYGKTIINKELEKQLKGKKVNDIIILKQALKTNAPLIELTLDDLDDENVYEFQEGQTIELTITEKPNLFVIEKLDVQAGRFFVRYKNPYEGSILKNIIKIEKIRKHKK